MTNANDVPVTLRFGGGLLDVVVTGPSGPVWQGMAAHGVRGPGQLTLESGESRTMGSLFGGLCVICKHGETKLGTGTVMLEREQTTVVFKKVPAQVCGNCGEQYYDEEITARLLEIAEEAAKAGVQVDVREYVAV